MPAAVKVAYVLVSLGLCAPAQEVRVYVSSNGGDRLAAKQSLHFVNPTADRLTRADAIFHVDSGVTDQEIQGFGASLLEAGMICLNSLPNAQQEDVLRKIFDPAEGAGFSAMKTVIAGTDFMSAGPWYSYDDLADDIGMKSFSVTRDLRPNGLITFIKRARRYGHFVLQAPMDYPPDWMLFDVNKGQDINPKYLDALALYYLRYLQEYEKNGVFVDYLSVFNEPGIYTKISFETIRDLIKNHVGPLFAREGVRTRLQPSEPNDRERAWKNFPIVLEDLDARKYVANLPYHGYGYKDYDKIAELHRRYPGLALWMTEVCHAYEAGTPKTMKLPRMDFADGAFWGGQIVSDLEAGASAWIYWNLILDETGGPWAVSPVHGNPDPNVQHPVVVINRKTREITYTGLYYYLAHFSKFVRPGAVRIGTTGSTKLIRAVTFRTHEGGIVSQLLNSGAVAAQVNVEFQGRWLAATLPPISISTFLWRP